MQQDPSSMLRSLCSMPPTVGSSQIALQRGLLGDLVFITSLLRPLAQRFAIISDTCVASLYGEALAASLAAESLAVALLTFPTGERQKTRATKERLEDQLLDLGYGSDSCIIALGGGVVTDLAGFLAATYCRGLPLVLIPTSLMAMVDASIGGKTAVNTPHGKNMVGALHAPRWILIDPALLATLPLRERRAGMVELIKHGLIASADLFALLEREGESLLMGQPQLLDQAIWESSLLKSAIVAGEELRPGSRHLLNFGHTIGHALECATHYALSHGEAVAFGLLVESYLACAAGLLPPAEATRIYRLLSPYLPPHTPTCSLAALLEAMALDKKAAGGRPRFVLIEGIGSACSFDGRYCTPLDEALIRDGLAWGWEQCAQANKQFS
jgi:3-dehydroquinate synthase